MECVKNNRVQRQTPARQSITTPWQNRGGSNFGWAIEVPAGYNLRMRALLQPEVLKSAAIASLVSSLACFPRLWLAPHQTRPLWYLEAVLFLGGIFLWGFVFAWHTKYTHRPVFRFKVDPVPFSVATVTGLAAALLLHLLLDPSLRARTPEDYPLTLPHWLAMTLFSLAFTQLFLVFAPFAWLTRLFRKPEPAILLTVIFGIFVFVVKNHASPTPIPSSLLLGLLVVRVATGLLSLYFFLRGGVLLVWWWGLLLQSRHLFQLDSGF